MNSLLWHSCALTCDLMFLFSLVLEQAYDPQTGYDIPYFRPTMDETVRGPGLPSPQEVS